MTNITKLFDNSYSGETYAPPMRRARPKLSFDDLLYGFRNVPIERNDLVMVHSSYKSLGGVQGGAETVVDAINELVFNEEKTGAVFYPRYTVNAWCNGRYFDHSETPGEMGIIPEIAQTRTMYRTRHPIHNFAICGPWRHEFNFDNKESFGRDGPFGLFHRENGLVISIGVYWDDTISFVHYVEQEAGASFRRQKNFAGIYVDDWGVAELVTRRMSVRKTRNHITHVAPLYDDPHEGLLARGVVKQFQLGDAVVSWFRCQEYYEAVKPLVQDRPDLFHYVKERSF